MSIRAGTWRVLLAAALLANAAPGLVAADRTVTPDEMDLITAELNARPDIPPRLGPLQDPADDQAARDCGLGRTELTLTVPEPDGKTEAGISRYGERKEQLPLLVDTDASGQGAVLASPERLTVDLDGSPHAYHPDDPFGACSSGPNEPNAACALDWLCNAGVRLFDRAAEIPCRERETYARTWGELWGEIAAGRAVPIPQADWLRDKSGRSGRRYGFFHPSRPYTVVMSKDIIPADAASQPCTRTGADHGYFVSATSLRVPGVSGDACTSGQFVDAAEIPAIVIPKGGFAGAALGDVAIGFLREPGGETRIAYGIVGDLGPNSRFGEATLAFNLALRGMAPRVWDGARDVARDTDIAAAQGRLTILILKGSAPITGAFKADTVRERARTAFSVWGKGSEEAGRKRMAACLSVLER